MYAVEEWNGVEAPSVTRNVSTRQNVSAAFSPSPGLGPGQGRASPGPGLTAQLVLGVRLAHTCGGGPGGGVRPGSR